MDERRWQNLERKVEFIEAMVTAMCAAGGMFLVLHGIARWTSMDSGTIDACAIIAGFLDYWFKRRSAAKRQHASAG